MRFVVSGRLREPCLLSPAEFFTLAIREWELVLAWLAAGKALAYGRLSAPPGGALLLDVGSEGEACALARALPFAPYAEMQVVRSDGEGLGRQLAELCGIESGQVTA